MREVPLALVVRGRQSEHYGRNNRVDRGWRAMEVAGKHALLTGASRGLGRVIAQQLVDAGMNVTLTARSDSELKELSGRLGSAASAVTADVASPDERTALLQAAEATFGPVDVLVNNAGVEYAATFAKQSTDEVERTVDVNLTAAMLLTRAVLPSMLERGYGHIVNVSSMSGLMAGPYQAAYSATKFGLVGFSQALRAELQGTGVSCSVVCPSFVAEEGMYARMADQGIKVSKAGVTTPDKVAGAVLAAVHSDKAQIIVSRGPLRPLVALQSLRPTIHSSLVKLGGATAFFKAVATSRGTL